MRVASPRLYKIVVFVLQPGRCSLSRHCVALPSVWLSSLRMQSLRVSPLTLPGLSGSATACCHKHVRSYPETWWSKAACCAQQQCFCCAAPSFVCGLPGVFGVTLVALLVLVLPCCSQHVQALGGCSVCCCCCCCSVGSLHLCAFMDATPACGSLCCVEERRQAAAGRAHPAVFPAHPAVCDPGDWLPHSFPNGACAALCSALLFQNLELHVVIQSWTRLLYLCADH